MQNINWLKLQSGTDIRGTALKSENKEVNLTEKVVETIGKSFISWLTKNIDKTRDKFKVAIGVDSRLTADKLKKHLITGITDSGVNVFDCGLASTPAMFMSTILDNHQYDGAIMITASHLPYDRNGFKFFTRKGGLEKSEIKKLLQIAADKDFKANIDNKGQVSEVNLIDDYTVHIRNTIKKKVNEKADKSRPLAGFNIIVDAGNGAGRFFVDKILKPLGADTSGSQFLEPDGNFPHHTPNPEDEEAMKAIKKAVVENNADLGIIFDTDVDRAAVVDNNGQSINRNKLIALAATIVLEENPGSYIVTDSVTSKGLKSFIEELGGYHHRFKRGYKNVINEAKRLEKENKDAPLAIETSGHAAFKENYFLDDGAYLIAKILIKMAKMKAENEGDIGDLIASLEEAEIKKEYRMTIKLDDFKDYGQQILNDLKTYVRKIDNWKVAPKNFEGVRVNCGGNDWFLLRLSLHDPVLVLNIECDDKNILDSIKTKLKRFLEGYKNLDLKSLA